MRRNRRVVQGCFLALVLVGVFGLHANCERWCPFGGVESLYTYWTEGNMLCSLGVSNFFILGGVLAATLLVRRAFCGYMCPLGTISEWLFRVGQRWQVPQVRVPVLWDRALSMLKYGVLVVVLVLTWRAGELIFRGFDPCYALISRHGEDITWWAYVVSALLIVASLVLLLPFCRWLCPLAAVLNLFSRFGLSGVQRDAEHCSECGKCARRCPMRIPVDRVQQVTAARCIACLECVAACPVPVARQSPPAADPVDGCLASAPRLAVAGVAPALHWGPVVARRQRWPQWLVIAILLCCTMGAVTTSYLVPVPSFVKRRGEAPLHTETVTLQIGDLTCRGRANLFGYFLDRDDLFAIPGYLHVAAWPGPGWADVQITFDPTQTDREALKHAITEPYFETEDNYWRPSPFQIQGYDPLEIPDLD